LDHGIGIDLLTVCDDENIDSLSSLIDVLCQVVSNPQARSVIQWSFTIVEPSETCAGRCAQVLLGKERRLAEAVHRAREYACKAGFGVVFPYSSNICGRQLDYTFGIGPQGEIYPCFGVYGDRRYSIGSISESFDTVEQRSKEWARRDCFGAECVSCEVLPLCRGSRCQHMAAQLNGGVFAQKYCERELLLEDIRRSLSSNLAWGSQSV
jgi:radical SAM protein with 4Fe4S-binding SPASM domain